MQIYSSALAQLGWRWRGGVSWERIGRWGTGTGTPIGNERLRGTVDIGVIRPSSSSNASGAGVGVGVELGCFPEDESNKQPRVDSSDMDGGLETGNAGKRCGSGSGGARVEDVAAYV